MAPNANSKLFATASKSDALTIARESIEVGLNEAGIAVCRFKFAAGKGTGLQEVPVAELPEFIAALATYSTDGINRVDRAVLTATEQLHATMSTVEVGDAEVEHIQFRVSGTQGKGSKPTRCLPSELANVVGFLRDTQGMIESEAAKLVPAPPKAKKVG